MKYLLESGVVLFTLAYALPKIEPDGASPVGISSLASHILERNDAPPLPFTTVLVPANESVIPDDDFDFSNVTRPAIAATNDDPTIYIALGPNAQHVGDALTAIYYLDGLVATCIDRLCKDYPNCDMVTACRIWPIDYNAKGHLANNAWLEIRVFAEFWKEGITKDLYEALKVQAAGTFRIEVKDTKNCYTITLDNREHTFCNVGDQVVIQEDKFGAWFRVRLAFNGPTAIKQFDCVAVKEATIRFLDGVSGVQFKKALGVDAFWSYIECADK